MASAKSRKNKNGVLMGYPVASKQLVGLLRKRNKAILGSLTTVYMDHHSFAVDVGDLQGKSFRDSQAASMDCGDASLVVKGFDTAQDAEDFFPGQDTGKALLLF